jgi:hypothetical protein
MPTRLGTSTHATSGDSASIIRTLLREGGRERRILLSLPASAAGVPSSESRVKRGDRIAGIDTELLEKPGRNDPCPCGSGRHFPPLLPKSEPSHRGRA